MSADMGVTEAYLRKHLFQVAKTEIQEGILTERRAEIEDKADPLKSITTSRKAPPDRDRWERYALPMSAENFRLAREILGDPMEMINPTRVGTAIVSAVLDLLGVPEQQDG
jgi:hypothetical protein